MARTLIEGTRGDDVLTGTSARELLRGKAGDDIIDGGGGNDRIVGGKGNDTLTGGDGVDRFVFRGDAGHDVITDFDPAEDFLYFRGTGTTNFDILVTDIEDTDAGVFMQFTTGGSLLLQGLTLADIDFQEHIWSVS